MAFRTHKLDENMRKRISAFEGRKPVLNVQQIGSGIFDTMKSAYKLSNAIATLPQKYPGEKHTILKLPNGEFSRANWAGPSTHIIERLKSIDNNQPLTQVDEISQKHDIDYVLAKSEGDVRNADNKMLSNLDKANDSQFNILPAKMAIKGKIALEDKLGIHKRAFTSFGSEGVKPEDLSLMKSKQEELIQKGLGKQREEEMIEYEKSQIKKPGQKLYESLVKKYGKDKKKKKFSKSTKSRYEQAKRIENKMQQESVPDNILNAIKGMKM